MEEQQIQEQDLKYKQLIFNYSHTNSEIELKLQGLKYHFKLSISLNLANQNKIDLITKTLSDLNHLKGIRITFLVLASSSNNILSIFKSLQSMNQLNELELYFMSKPNEFMEEMQIQLANSLNYLPKLNSLTTTLPCFIKTNSKGKDLIQKSLLKLNSLKQLRLNLSVQDSESISELNDFLADINKLNNLTQLSIGIKSEFQQENTLLQYAFDNLKKIIDLEIKLSSQCKANISSLISQINYLTELKKLNLSIQAPASEDQLRQLFNTVLNLQQIEEFVFVYEEANSNDKLVFGEEVCEDSKLKILKLNIVDRIKAVQNTGYFVFGKELKRLKNLEVLSLEPNNFIFCQDSIRALSEWRDEWKQLKELTIKNSFYRTKFENFSIITEIVNGFSVAKSITKLNLTLTYKNQANQTDVFSGISHLENLESLSCEGIYFTKLVNYKEKYLSCFKKLSNLKELILKDLKSSEELICIGESLKYLTELVRLDIEFCFVFDFEYFDIFCKNLRFLKKLNQFLFQTSDLFASEYDYMSSGNVQMLLQGILHLKALRILTITPEIQDQALKMFNTELLVLIKTLSNLNKLTIPIFLLKKNKSKILRYCKRLIYQQQQY